MRTLLRPLRICIAIAVLLLFAAGFINLHNNEPAAWEHVVERVQFVPALLGSWSGLACALGILIALVVITLLFGRVYCSFLCPLGIAQDIVFRLRRAVDRALGRKPSATMLRYAHPVPLLRYIVLGLTISGALFFGAAVLAWVDPYSICARFFAGVANPLVAQIAEAVPGSSGAAPTWGRYGWLLVIIVPMFLLPLVLAWWRGRIYCNTLCPVGALLGLFSRRALLRIAMDPTACVRCAACVRACKAQCIDLKNYRVDASRCVNCYDCVSACDHGLRPRLINPFRPSSSVPTKPSAKTPHDAPDPSRRAFLGIMAVTGTTTVLSSCSRRNDETPASGENTAAATTPPGSLNVPRFLEHCTGCGLCITACPTRVLQPSMLQFGVRGFFKPHLDFTRGFCNFDCTACSTVCPEGAILPISRTEKQRTQIALASFHSEHCIVHCNQTECGACTEHCPTKALSTFEGKVPTCNPSTCIACNVCVQTCPRHAISLVSDGHDGKYAQIDRSKCIACGKCARVCPSGAMQVKRLMVPVLDEKLCIGCGACSFACPVRPTRAMQVTPRAYHLTAERLRQAPAVNPVGDEFPF